MAEQTEIINQIGEMMSVFMFRERTTIPFIETSFVINFHGSYY